MKFRDWIWSLCFGVAGAGAIMLILDARGPLEGAEIQAGKAQEFRQAMLALAKEVVDLTGGTIEIVRDHEERIQEIEYALRWRRFDEMGLAITDEDCVELPPIILEDETAIGELGE